MNLKIVKHADVPMPKYANATDAGLDLHAAEELVIEPGQRVLVGTGLKMEFPDGYAGLIWDRSGISTKHGISTLAGVIDAGYRGEIRVALINLGQEPFTVEKHMRIAQMLFQCVERAEIELVDALGETARGDGGFGSSGLK
ncbi:hypothetical protein A2333_00245 [Candidatus Wolfebacteria bacterium RIFOXYB2_FULL_49_7]|nr:MAG: hypothetical protein A2333_00245 [Candidatus Wolfebacteria bacterium RIFOXYB2_FULL_49_7]